jgi:hypothetical protein
MRSPHSSRGTSELVYLDVTQRVIAVPYTVADGAFRAGKPVMWAEQPVMNRPRDRDFDIDPSGNRLVAVAEVSQDVGDEHVAVVFNAFAEIRRIAPAGQAR